MNIQQFRKKYPEYNDMSDKELSDRLYERHYSDMPRSEFNKRFGYTPPPEPSFAQKALDAVSSMGFGAAQNEADMGSGAINLAHKALPYFLSLPLALASKAFKEKTGNIIPQVGRMNIAQMAADPTWEKVGEFVDPTMYAIPELGAEAKGAEMLETAGRAANPLEKLASKLANIPGAQSAAKGGATGALYGALSTPDDQATAGTVSGATGAALSGALGLPGEMLGNALQKYARSAAEKGSTLRTPAEVEQLTKLLRTPGSGTENLPLNLGDLINSPGLSSFYHDTLANIPFSGARQKGAQVLNAARAHAQNIVDNLKHGVDDSKIDQYLLQTVKHNHGFVKDLASEKFNDLYSNAADSNIQPYAKNLSQTAQDLLNEFKGQGETRVSKEDLDSLEKASNLYSPRMTTSGTKVVEPADFEDLRNNESIYGEKARELAAHGDRTRAKVYTQLKNAASQDLEDAIQNSNNPELSDRLADAKDFYKKYVVPYENSDITKLRYRTLDPDNIHSVLLKGDNLDVVNQMTPADKDVLAYKKFMKSVKPDAIRTEMANPFRLINYYDSLSPKQQSALFGGRPIQGEFDKLRALTKISREPALAEAKPATGYRMVGKGLEHGLTGLGVTGLVSPLLRVPALAGLATILGGARGAQKALTSDLLRNAYVRGSRYTAPGTSTLSKLISQAVSQHLSKDLTRGNQ